MQPVFPLGKAFLNAFFAAKNGADMLTQSSGMLRASPVGPIAIA